MTHDIKKTATDIGYEYTLNGIMHHEDGPAHDCYDGSKVWYQHGIIHRTN